MAPAQRDAKGKGKGRKPQFIHEPIQVTGTLRLFSTESEHPAHLAEFGLE